MEGHHSTTSSKEEHHDVEEAIATDVADGVSTEEDQRAPASSASGGNSIGIHMAVPRQDKEASNRNSSSTSTLLNQAKRYLSYPRDFQHKQRPSVKLDKSASKAVSGGRGTTRSSSLPALRGIAKNPPPSTKKIGDHGGLSSSCPTGRASRSNNESKLIRGLRRDNQPKVSISSHYYPTDTDGHNIVGEGNGITTKLSPQGRTETYPSIISYLDEDNISKQPPHVDGQTEEDAHHQRQQMESNNPISEEEDEIVIIDGMQQSLIQDNNAPPSTSTTAGRGGEAADLSLLTQDDVPATTTTTTTQREADLPPPVFSQQNAAALPGNTNDDGLVEAMPVLEQEQFDDDMMMQAQPIDQQDLEQQQAVKKAKEMQHRRYALGFVAVACTAVILSLAIIGLTKNKKNKASLTTTADVIEKDDVVPTASPTRPLPPMEMLELLYDELPDKTRASLYNNDSPQYHAWEWLLNHPNISTYPEWRKKQIFAMATFFYSFEGPNWPASISQNWLNYSLSECTWINTDLNLLRGLSIQYLGESNSYDFRPCNEFGKIQTIAMLTMQMKKLKPFIPPEISLLSSLSILSLLSSSIEAPLEAMLPPEVFQLPNLSVLIFHGNHLMGTIPPQILSGMTSIKHILIGSNKLTGSIPAELGAMTTLQYLGLQENQLTGRLPSQLGLLTMMSALQLYRNSLSHSIPSELGTMCLMEDFGVYDNPSITGRIPSELGQMSNVRALLLYRNSLFGSIPSQLAILTKLTDLSLSTNFLSGFVPTELGSLTSLSIFHLQKNRLTGRIPSEVGLLSNLAAFSIFGNAMFGSIPSELGLISNMSKFWIKNNTLSGIIPTELWQLTKLKEFAVAGNPLLSGVIPEWLCPLQESGCVHDVSSWDSGNPNRPCALQFDCTEKLCGCDCSCASKSGGNQSFVRRG